MIDLAWPTTPDDETSSPLRREDALSARHGDAVPSRDVHLPARRAVRGRRPPCRPRPSGLGRRLRTASALFSRGSQGPRSHSWRRRPRSACLYTTLSGSEPSSASSMRLPMARAPSETALSRVASQSGAATVSASVQATRPAGGRTRKSRAHASSITTRRAAPEPSPGPSRNYSLSEGCAAAISRVRASVPSVQRSRTYGTSYSSCATPSCAASARRQASTSTSSSCGHDYAGPEGVTRRRERQLEGSPRSMSSRPRS